MTLEKKNDTNEVQILSAAGNFTYFKEPLNEEEIINVMSDLKHRIFPRPFERLSILMIFMRRILKESDTTVLMDLD